MNRLRSLWVYAAFLAVIFGGLFFLPPDRPPDARPGPQAILTPDPEWWAKSEARRAAGLSRGLAKRRIAQDVLAQRMPLLEAAGHFRDLNEGNPDVNWDVFRRDVTGSSDDERYCWLVIGVVESEARCRDPNHAAVVKERLEAELRGHLRNGTLRLRK
jgi:hypothetical protein